MVKMQSESTANTCYDKMIILFAIVEKYDVVRVKAGCQMILVTRCRESPQRSSGSSAGYDCGPQVQARVSNRSTSILEYYARLQDLCRADIKTTLCFNYSGMTVA